MHMFVFVGTSKPNKNCLLVNFKFQVFKMNSKDLLLILA